MDIPSLFRVNSPAEAVPFVFAGILAVILIISFRSRAWVFCQYLRRMTGISLKPSEVRAVFRERGADGVREMFLDLIIRQDLKEGPLKVPEIKEKAEPREAEIAE